MSRSLDVNLLACRTGDVSFSQASEASARDSRDGRSLTHAL